MDTVEYLEDPERLLKVNSKVLSMPTLHSEQLSSFSCINPSRDILYTRKDIESGMHKFINISLFVQHISEYTHKGFQKSSGKKLLHFLPFVHKLFEETSSKISIYNNVIML